MKSSKLNATAYRVDYNNHTLDIKSFSVNADKLYLVTRDNKIYVKKNVYDFYKGICTEGSVTFFKIIF